MPPPSPNPEIVRATNRRAEDVKRRADAKALVAKLAAEQKAKGTVPVVTGTVVKEKVDGPGKSS